MKKAKHYETTHDGNVICRLCNHACHIAPGKRGICMVRENRNGELFALAYGKLVSGNVDPVEKKPLFHFLPGSMTFSIATAGCNFRCLHCQNFQISQYPVMQDGALPGTYVKAESVVESALNAQCDSVSYTYVEPTIFYEYAFDVASVARSKGLKNIFVSNGYMQGETVRELCSVLDAINIDLKFFNDSSYKKICGACLQPVLDNIKLFYELGIWLEITTLVIPGINDSIEELRNIAKFIKGISRTIPWHVTAFQPTYKMTNRPPASTSFLEMASDIGREVGLLFVYEGNHPGAGKENSVCPSCGMEVVRRYGFTVTEYRLKNGKCERCGHKLAGVWR